MRLTALCVCGTLLAFSSLFWITADSDEGVLLDLEKGFGPCSATLIPEEPCRQGQHESTCPYLFSLPPLTVQLPQQLRELERIVQDLEKLKDSVDQLREMCADCTVSHTERQCERQRELDKPNEDDNERSWLNERLQESDRDYREEGGTNRGKEETMEGDGDSGKSFILEEKERKGWEEERESEEGVKKDKKDKSVSGVSEKDDKTKLVGTKQKDKMGQTNMSTAGGDMKIKKTETENVADKNTKKSESEKNRHHATKGSSEGYEEAEEEKGEERKVTTNVKNKEKTEESEHLERQYETEETEKKTQTEASDRRKMSVDHGVHTNRERGEHGEERKREMEKGTKVEQNNEKPKQTESIGHSEKEKTIKVGEVEEEEEEEDREMGEEIKPEGEKTERAQGNGDGELSSSKAIERTDFVSVSPTPDSTIIVASRPDSSDSNKAVIFTSSLPSPSLPSSTSGLITNVSPETITTYAPTQSSGQRAAGISEQLNPDAGLVFATTPASTLGGPGQQMTSTTADLITASGVKPVSGFKGDVSPSATVTAPYEGSYVTATPRTTERSRWAAKKNISSNTKTGVKPLPGRGPKFGERFKPEAKPEADRELKHPKNDRKLDRGNSPDKKTKTDQKQKLPHNKPTTNQTKPASVPKRVHNLKPDQKPPPDVSSTPKPKPEKARAPNKNKQPAQKPKSNQKIVTPVQRPQRPQTGNTTRSDRYPSIDRETEGIPNTAQNRKSVYPVNRPDGKKKHEMKPESPKTKRPDDQTFERNQDRSYAQEPEFRSNEMTILTAKPDQDAVTESSKEFVVNPPLESISNEDPTPVPAQEILPDRTNTQPDERKKPNKKIPILNKKPVVEENPSFEPTSNKHSTTGQKTPDPVNSSPDKKLMLHQNLPTVTEEPVSEPMKRPEQKPTSNEGSTPEQKITPDQGNTGLDQESRPSDKVQTMNPKSATESVEESEQNPSFESDPDSTPGQKNTPGWVNSLPNEKFIPTQKTPKRDQPVSESTKKTSESPSTGTANTDDSTHGQIITPDRARARPDQTFTPGQKIPSANQQPSSNRESDENPTIKPTYDQDLNPEHNITPDQDNTQPNQRFDPSQDITTKKQHPVTDTVLESEKNLSFESVTNPGLIPEKKFPTDQDSTSQDEKLTPRQGITTFNGEAVTETMKKSDENPLLDMTTKADSTPGRKITPDQDSTLPNQRFKPTKGIPAANQKPLTHPMKKPEKKPTKPKYTEASTPRKKITPDQDDAQPDQKVKLNQITTTIHPKLESERYKENPLHESEFSPDVTPGQKITPDQAKTRPDQTFNPNQGIPTINQKSETESMEESDDNTSSNKDSTSGQKMTPDEVIRSRDQQLEPREIIPRFDQQPGTELMDTTDKSSLSDPTSTSTPGQNIIPDGDNAQRNQHHDINQEIPTINVKPVNESVGKSYKNVTLKPDEDPTSGQKTTPERFNTQFNPNPETPTMNQKPVTETMDESDESTSTKKDSTPGENITPDQAFKSPDQQLTPSQNIPTFDQEPVTESMEKPDHTTDKESTPENNIIPDGVNTDQKKDQETTINREVPIIHTKPVMESDEKSEKNFTSKPSSHQEPTSGRKKPTPKRVNTRPDQKFKPNQKIPTITPTNRDSTPGERISPDQAVITPDQQLTPSQNIPTLHQEPVTESMEKSDSTPGQSISPDQVDTRRDPKPKVNTKPVIESDEKSERNVSSKPSSHQDPTSGRKKPTPERVNTRPSQKFKPNQKIPTINRKPVTETMDESDESTPTKKDSTPGEKITPDRTFTLPDQQLTPSQNIPTFDQEPVIELMEKSDSTPGQSILPDHVDTRRDPKPKVIQEIPTVNTKPVIESDEKSERNFSSKPSSHQDPTSGRKKPTPERVNTRPDQKFKPNQKIPTINLKPVTATMDESDESTSTKKDSTPGEKITPDRTERVNTRPSQKFKPNQKIPTVNLKPTETMDKFDENTLTNKDSTPGEKISPDQAVITPGQQLTPSQNTPTSDQEPVTESMEKSDSTLGQSILPDQVDTRRDPKPKVNTKPVIESDEKSERNISSKTSFKQDPTSGRKKPTPERVNTRPAQKFKPNQKIPTINRKPVTETMDESDASTSAHKDLTLGENITPDQTFTLPDQQLTPSQNIPTLHQEPVTESMEKSDSTPGHSILPDQVDTRQDPKPKVNTKPVIESDEKSERNISSKPSSHQDPTSGKKKPTPERVNTRPDQKFKPNQKIPKINQKPKPGQGLKPNQKPLKPVTDLRTKPNVSRKTDQAPHSNERLKTPKPLPDEVSRVESNKTSKQRPPPRYRLPIRPSVKPGATPDQKPKQAGRPEPSQRTKTHLDPPQISWTTSDGIQSSQSGVPPVPGPGKEISEGTHSTKGTEFNPSMRETVTLDPKAANSLETGPFPHLHTPSEDSTVSSNSRTASDLKPQTTSRPPSIPTTTQPNKMVHGTLPPYVSSTTPESAKPNIMLESDPSSQTELLHNVDEAAATMPAPPPGGQITSTPSPDFRSATPATSGLQPPAAESSTPSARELRVKINQVAAFLNNSLSPNGRQAARHPKQHPEDTQGGSRPDGTEAPTLTPSKVSTLMRDCSDHRLRGVTRSGVYLVTPDLRSRSFRVFCDMEHDGGGWTVVQRRQDGSVSFNRTWTEYQAGFGEPRGGEFWLGNNMIHLLTRERDMTLRVELEDFDGVEEFARYEHFRVASERLRYRLTVGGYSGTAGDALRFNKRYDHNNRAFTTPDRDNDRYPSGNCGAYYSSGWWFDACMAANLNGRYYVGSYKGVRDGIFWGTWHNISTEYYPTNDRQSFKRVRMMIRPRGFAL